jgi:hypothetical protein
MARADDDPLRGTALAENAALRGKLLPCVRILARPVETGELPAGASRFGGAPDLPADLPWPVRRSGEPLAFLAQLAWADLSRACPSEALPTRGALFFFYDAAAQPWGHAADCDGWRVLDTLPGALRRPPGHAAAESPTCAVDFRATWSLPSAAVLTYEEVGAAPGLRDVRAAMTGIGGHRFLGYPDEVQGSMYGGFPGVLQTTKDRPGVNPFTKEAMIIPGITLHGVPADVLALLRTKAEWRLLLQLDSDDELGWCWGDMGTLYFWIREDDLRARRFDRVWLQLQCS